MSLPSGFVLKDSHLIRGVAALVVISVLVPGIFGVGPPQYFGDDDTRLAALQQPDEAPPTPTPTPDMPAPDMPAAEIKTAQTDGAAKLEEPAVPARVPPASKLSRSGLLSLMLPPSWNVRPSRPACRQLMQRQVTFQRKIV